MSASCDTIVAEATAPGRGGIAVIRLSGPLAFDIAERLSRRPMRPGKIDFSPIYDSADNQTLIDRCVVLAFAAPRSYTGEDVVEFQCHGGVVTPRRIIAACCQLGARCANPGEYTLRAFINGKIDISQAESVVELVDAKSERSAQDALDGVNGKRQQRYRVLYDCALAISSNLEHSLDVDEEDLADDFIPNRRREIAELQASLTDELSLARAGEILRKGALVVLAGAPNAGKSSLMNALLGTDRAIVSQVPGTTRDTIEEYAQWCGWPIRLVDTAGLRRFGGGESSDEIELEGIRRAEKLIGAADVVIAVDCEIPGALRVHAKSDIGPGEGLPTSALTGDGIAALKSAVVNRLSQAAGVESGEALSATPSEREAAIITSSRASAEQANELLADDELVLAANLMRDCATRLGSLTGAEYNQDLLNNIFSRFCVGK